MYVCLSHIDEVRGFLVTIPLLYLPPPKDKQKAAGSIPKVGLDT